MTSTIRRVTATTFVAGIAALGVAAPVHAQEAHQPEGPGASLGTGVTAPTDSTGWEWTQVATGALGGIALAGAGVAAAAGVRRHHAHATPA